MLGKQRNRSQSPTRSEPSTRCNFPSLRTFRLAGRGWGTLTRGSSLAWKAAKSFAVPGLLPDKREPAAIDKVEPADIGIYIGVCVNSLVLVPWHCLQWPMGAFITGLHTPYINISRSPLWITLGNHQVPTGSHAHVSDTLHSPCQRNASRRCTGPVHTFSPGGHTWLPPGIPRQSPSHMSDPVALPNSTDRRTGMLYACTGAHLVQ